MPWDPTMPTSMADGNTVDQGDLNPVFNNLNQVRYATVFLGGIRRITQVTNVGSSEVAVMQTPTVSFEVGTLYELKGFLKWFGNTVNDYFELRLHEGAGTGGSVVQSFATNLESVTGVGYMTPFNLYVKTLSAISRPYTLGVRRLSGGTGVATVDTTSQMVILRSGDSSLMTDV